MASTWDAERATSEEVFGRDRRQDHPIAIRMNEESGAAVCSILGQCKRNPITGQCLLQNASISTDFGIVDLWERDLLFGSADELAHDPYLFKVVPLPVRTWIYHYYFGREEHMSKARGDHGVMERVLDHQVVDANLAIGQWSPAVCYAPVALVSVFSGDSLTSFVCIAAAVFNIVVAAGANTPRFFHWVRPITAVPRFVFFFFICVRLGQIAGEGAGAILSCLVIIVLLLVDFFRGDIPAISGAGNHCNYRVVRVLPNRIFVCCRNGAAFLEDKDRGKVHECISSVGDWHNEMTMIAEIRGLVAELRPMQLHDWELVWQERQSTGRPTTFMGLDVFNNERATVDILDLEVAKKGPDGAKAALMAMVASGQLKRKSTRGSMDGKSPGFLE